MILKVAADMFCELGYERISLRNISEKAGVSHSLIRHHFGSKEKIWQAVSDGMDEFLQLYMAELINQMPQEMPSNRKIYLFMVRMLAFALVNPHPIQMIADAIRQGDDALLQYFLRSKDEFAEIFTKLFADYNVEYPETPIDQWESKWQMLINHWELFNTIMANQFGVEKAQMIHPAKLNDIVIDMFCPIEDLTP